MVLEQFVIRGQPGLVWPKGSWFNSLNEKKNKKEIREKYIQKRPGYERNGGRRLLQEGKVPQVGGGGERLRAFYNDR